MITLVLGGAASGKSTVAERLAATLPQPVTYIATGVATDDDMAARIEAHKQRRPADWKLVEVTGEELVAKLRAISGTVLVDSLGTWIASLEVVGEGHDAALCGALAERDGDSVVVSDEVGLSVHPSTEVGRKFRDDIGRLNQAVAALAGDVLFVIAGRVLPLVVVDQR